MRKVVFLIHISLDGFAAGPNGEMDWIVYNDDLEEYAHDLHSQTDAAIYGRVTYQMMEGYWPTVLTNPDSPAGAMAHARWLDSATKIVASKTLNNVQWKNTVVIRDNLAAEMTKIKQQPGKNLWMIGSPTLAKTFMQHDLIDEYRINVNPVALGCGLSLFEGLDKPLNLKLIDSRTFKGGVVGLRYEPQRK